MFLEITSSVLMSGVVGYTYYLQKGIGNDAQKIQRICENVGLVVKERNETKTIRLHRKTKHDWGHEYVYQIPLGLSFKDFEKKRHIIEDGLNNKYSVVDLSLEDIKKVDIRGDIRKQVKDILNKKKAIRKEIELFYDGMLKVHVYQEPMTNTFSFSECKSNGWRVPIGKGRMDIITHDFEKRSHMIVAGTTGFGKSEMIKAIITFLIKQQPWTAKLHLIDLKGGLELGRFKDLSQTVSFSRDPKEARETLQSIQKEMNKKLDELFEKGYNSVQEAKQRNRYFVIIDESADMADDKESMEIVTDIARRGRAAGYRLVYATQYPTNETLPSQVRANIGARVCFRLETGYQSRAVLDEEGAESLPEIEGRAIFRRVKNHIVQTPYITTDEIEEIIRPHRRVKHELKERTEDRADTLVIREAGLS